MQVINSSFRSLFMLNKFLISIVSPYLPRSSKLSQLYHHGDPSNHCKASTLFLSSFISSDHPFITRVLYGGYMMFHKGFNPFSKCSSRFFSEELKYSLSCILKCNPFNRIIRGGIMSFLIIGVHVS